MDEIGISTKMQSSLRTTRIREAQSISFNSHQCGYSYIGMTRRQKHQYYYCKGKAQKPVSLCDMPNFKADVVNDAVWLWVESILFDPEALAEGLRNAQATEREKNRTLYDGMEIITRQLEESEQQLARLLDLYISGDFDKEMLIERKSRLESTIDKLKHEKTELEVRINAITYSDEDIATLEAFCATIKTKLNMATFEDKRHILDLLDVRGTLAIENGERIIYVQCLIAPQPVSLVLTSHWSNNHNRTQYLATARLSLSF